MSDEAAVGQEINIKPGRIYGPGELPPVSNMKLVQISSDKKHLAQLRAMVKYCTVNIERAKADMESLNLMVTEPHRGGMEEFLSELVLRRARARYQIDEFVSYSKYTGTGI